MYNAEGVEFSSPAFAARLFFKIYARPIPREWRATKIIILG